MGDSAAVPSVVPSVRPTRVRYGVLAFAATLAMVTYLDRSCFSMAVDEIAAALGLSSREDVLRWAAPAFAIAYALFEVPTGWLGDRFGPRHTLLRIVLWWSLFTGLTAVVGFHVCGVVLGLGFLVTIRFLFGVGEAGAFPNITRALHNWFPLTQRGFAQGTVWTAARLAGGLTPLIWWVIVSQAQMPWRDTFCFFAAIGLIWSVLFWRWFRNRPEEHPGTNEAERALIVEGRNESEQRSTQGLAIPWKHFLRNRNVWLLGLMYACQSYGWFFYITYLPTYYKLRFPQSASGWLGALCMGSPLWVGAIGCFVGGKLTDWYIRRTGDLRNGRRYFGAFGHGATAICFLLCPMVSSAAGFFVTIALAGFFTDLTMGSSWAMCQDVGRRFAAVVAGTMNMIGNVGSALAGWVTGTVVIRAVTAHAAAQNVAVAQLSDAARAAGEIDGYTTAFGLFALACGIGVCCWLLLDARISVDPEAEIHS